MEKTMIGDDEVWDATIIGAGPAGATIKCSSSTKAHSLDIKSVAAV
jgi:hypothetical protein